MERLRCRQVPHRRISPMAFISLCARQCLSLGARGKSVPRARLWSQRMRGYGLIARGYAELGDAKCTPARGRKDLSSTVDVWKPRHETRLQTHPPSAAPLPIVVARGDRPPEPPRGRRRRAARRRARERREDGRRAGAPRYLSAAAARAARPRRRPCPGLRAVSESIRAGAAARGFEAGEVATPTPAPEALSPPTLLAAAVAWAPRFECLVSCFLLRPAELSRLARDDRRERRASHVQANVSPCARHPAEVPLAGRARPPELRRRSRCRPGRRGALELRERRRRAPAGEANAGPQPDSGAGAASGRAAAPRPTSFAAQPAE